MPRQRSGIYQFCANFLSCIELAHIDQCEAQACSYIRPLLFVCTLFEELVVAQQAACVQGGCLIIVEIHQGKTLTIALLLLYFQVHQPEDRHCDKKS